MATEINFTKKVTNESVGQNNLPVGEDRKFNDLKKSSKKKDPKELFKVFDSVFYKIPKTGKRSHTSLILDSEAIINNYVYPEDHKIKILSEAIEEKENELNKLEQPEIDADPFFPNGSFIRSNYLNTQGLPVWIMVNGLRREFKNIDTLNVARKALGFDTIKADKVDEDVNIQETDEDILDQIPAGDDILNEEDLVLIDFQTEGSIVDFDPNSVFGGVQSFSAGCFEKQHYDNKGECEISYFDLLGNIQTAIMETDQLLTDNPSEEQLSRTVGPRLQFQKDPNSTLQNGLIEVKGYVRLYKGNDTFEYNPPTDIELGGPPRMSNFGTRMFTKLPPVEDGFTYDAMGDPGVYEHVLKDKNNPYYDIGAIYKYPPWHGGSDVDVGNGTDVYGAPILRYDNRYIVELQSFGSFSNIGSTSSVMYLVVSGGEKGKVKRFKKHRKWKQKKLGGESRGSLSVDGPFYGSNIVDQDGKGRLKYYPAKINNEFRTVGYTFNNNGKNKRF